MPEDTLLLAVSASEVTHATLADVQYLSAAHSCDGL